MKYQALRTNDRSVALATLQRCLDSEDSLNVRLEHRDGMYSIEVSEPVMECADESIAHADLAETSPDQTMPDDCVARTA